jgi:hypothetical protein
MGPGSPRGQCQTVLFGFVLGSFSEADPLFSIRYWLRSLTKHPLSISFSKIKGLAGSQGGAAGAGLAAPLLMTPAPASPCPPRCHPLAHMTSLAFLLGLVKPRRFSVPASGADRSLKDGVVGHPGPAAAYPLHLALQFQRPPKVVASAIFSGHWR